jgi:hypothetical protein
VLQIAIALGGITLLLAAATAGLVGTMWLVLVAVRHLPLVGRRGKPSSR